MIRRGINRLVLAAALGTIVPMPHLRNVDDAELVRSMGFFPVVGLMLGLLLWGGMWAGVHLMARTAAAVLVLGLYVLATGALHLDGMGDTFDALGSRKTYADALAVMKDSRIGTIGAAAVMVVLLGKAIAFSRISVSGPGPWVVVPIFSRTAAVWSMRISPSARPDGLGAMYAQHLPRSMVIAATIVAVLVAYILLPWQQLLILLLLSVGVTFSWTLLIWRRFGGATGDTYGALIEIVEWLGFLTLTGGWGYGR